MNFSGSAVNAVHISKCNDGGREIRSQSGGDPIPIKLIYPDPNTDTVSRVNSLIWTKSTKLEKVGCGANRVTFHVVQLRSSASDNFLQCKF